MERFEQDLDTNEVHTSLTRALEWQGIYGVSDDLVVKRATSPSGRTWYVITACNGIESVVGKILSPCTPHKAACGAGVWVLRCQPISELLTVLHSDR